MSRPQRAPTADIPHLRPQRTPPTITQTMNEPKTWHGNYGLTLTETIGRIPTIGIDSGAIPGTRPDHIRHDMA